MQYLNPPIIAGSPYEIGFALGSIARPVFDSYLDQSAAWRAVRVWRGHPFVQRLRQATEAAFPDYMREIEGMAAGMRRSAEDVFLWNCRGELIHNAPDGCTTLAATSPDARFIAHNEDGDPYLRNKCTLVDVRPTAKPGFVSFYYPGSLPGHTFAVTRAGLVQAINNIRIKHPAAGVPRMVLARAVLDAATLEAAVELLGNTARASGFHHTLAAVSDKRLFSVEATARRASVVEVRGLSGHTNHLIHEGCEGEAQLVTQSSSDRQARLGQLLPRLTGASGPELLSVLRDQAPSGLPIYRDDPADPDDENTLATGLFIIKDSGVEFEMHQYGELRYRTTITVESRAKADS